MSTCSWVGGTLLEEGAGRFDHFQLGLRSLMRRRARRQRIGIVTLETRSLPGVDQRLAPPFGEGDLGDPELDPQGPRPPRRRASARRSGGEVRPRSALAYWLLCIRAKLSYRWSTVWGPGQKEVQVAARRAPPVSRRIVCSSRE